MRCFVSAGPLFSLWRPSAAGARTTVRGEERVEAMRSRAGIVAAVLGVALVSGGWLMQAGYDGAGSHVTSARLFDEVMKRVENFYVDTITEPQLYRKAVYGFLLELHDPHSVYLPPDRLAKLNESTM